MSWQGEISDRREEREIDHSHDKISNVWMSRELKEKAMPAKVQITKTKNREIVPISTDNSFVLFLSRMIDEAKEIICLSSFMLQQGDLIASILKAVERNVRVYILTAGEEDLASADADMDDIEKLKLEDYKQLLNSLRGKTLVRTAPHFHAKFLLVDPKSQDPRGVMMTCNATVDAMTGKNFEVAVTLTRPEVASFFSQFVQAFWRESKHELLVPNRLGDLDPPLQTITFGQISHYATLAGTNSLKQRVIELIDSAKVSIIATGWSFAPNHPVIVSLQRALEKGVNVEIFTRPSLGNTEALTNLVTRGAQIVAHSRYHAKVLIVDGEKSLLMTSNFSEKGLDTGFETGIELDVEETKAILALIKSWETFCDRKLVTLLSLGSAPKTFERINSSSRKLEIVEVLESAERDLGIHSMYSLSDKPYQPSFPDPNTPTSLKLFKKVRYFWRIQVPILPRKASIVQSKESFPFPLYQLPNKEYFVVVRLWEEVDNAKIFGQRFKARIVIQRPATQTLQPARQQTINSKK